MQTEVFSFLESSVKFQLEIEKRTNIFEILGPQNEYYYYEGDEQYGDDYYDNKKYKETHNYGHMYEGIKEFKNKQTIQRSEQVLSFRTSNSVRIFGSTGIPDANCMI